MYWYCEQIFSRTSAVNYFVKGIDLTGPKVYSNRIEPNMSNVGLIEGKLVFVNLRVILIFLSIMTIGHCDF